MKKAHLSIRTRVHFLMASNLTHGVKVGSLLTFCERHEDMRTTAPIFRREIRDWLNGAKSASMTGVKIVVEGLQIRFPRP